MASLIRGMSSEAYHSHPNSFSSSQLKTILEDPSIFYKKYILKEGERETNSAFDIGTYFHTAILEPDKLQEDCAVYVGIRRGKEWESFKELNSSKAIITSSELDQANNLIKAVKSSRIARDYLSKGEAEVSGFATLLVHGGEIFCNDKVLTEHGWGEAEGGWLVAFNEGIHIEIKVRADLLGANFILDLKSTTGNVRNEHLMRTKISSYSYDLSASLYLDIFSIITGREYKQFIWTFASKDYGTCKNYLASDNNIKVGRAKWMKAVLLLAKNIGNNWEFEDELSVIDPQYFELEHLNFFEEIIQ